MVRRRPTGRCWNCTDWAIWAASLMRFRSRADGRMTASVSDEMVHLFTAVGTHKEIAGAVERRFGGLSDAVFASINSTIRSDLPSDVLADIRRIPVSFKVYRTAW